jgi:hypothetical protein
MKLYGKVYEYSILNSITFTVSIYDGCYQVSITKVDLNSPFTNEIHQM